MGYGTAQQTTTTGAIFLPTIWAKNVELAREALKVMAGLVNRRDADVSQSGSTLNIPFVSNLSATAVSDNTAVTFQAPTETQVQVSINRHFESSVMIQDRLGIQSAYDLAVQYQEKTAEALSRQIDTDLTGLYTSVTQKTGVGTTTLTEPNIVRASQYLNAANAPMDNRHFVVKEDAMQQLQQLTRFTDYQSVNNGVAPMVGGNNGLVGNVFGNEVHMTTDITTVSGTPGTAHNLLFHRDAFVLCIQKEVGVERQRRPDFLGTGYIASALWGYTVLRASHAVDVQTTTNA